MQTAVDREDYTRAAKIRDKLGKIQLDDSLGEPFLAIPSAGLGLILVGVLAAVLQVNAAFYSAFRNCDMVQMGDVWLRPDSEHDTVACGHPAMPLITGCPDAQCCSLPPLQAVISADVRRLTLFAGRENVLQSWRDILDGVCSHSPQCNK